MPKPIFIGFNKKCLYIKQSKNSKRNPPKKALILENKF